MGVGGKKEKEERERERERLRKGISHLCCCSYDGNIPYTLN